MYVKIPVNEEANVKDISKLYPYPRENKPYLHHKVQLINDIFTRY
jgi:hypothetical protein